MYQPNVLYMNEIHQRVEFSSTEGRHEGAIQGGMFLNRSERGLLLLAGNDTLDFLQRMSTNDLPGMKLNEYRTTVFVNDKGRIIDIGDVLLTEVGVLLAVSQNNALSMKSHLEKFVVMDDVTVTDISANYRCYLLLGDDLPAVIREQLHKDVIKENEVLKLGINGWQGYLYRNSLWQKPVYNLFIKQNPAPDNHDAIQSGIGKLFSASEINPDILETLRIENMVPLFGKELTEHVNPLEANLQEFVSFTKGCYIGQEVIARLDTYKKIQKQLCRFIISSPKGTVDEKGTLLAEGKEVGRITSHTWSYKLNKTIALGYLKINMLDASLECLSTANEKRYPCEVIPSLKTIS